MLFRFFNYAYAQYIQVWTLSASDVGNETLTV